MKPVVDPILDPASKTITYIVSDPNGRDAVIIDPVLDFDATSGRASTDSADALIAQVRARGLEVGWILETHAHADHITAAPHLAEQLGAQIGIGAGIIDVQKTFAPLYGLEAEIAPDGGDFDRLFADGERFACGALDIEVIATPGHTPACVVYRIGDTAFCGDTIFMPDFGSARCDFPGGDARQLYHSAKRILALPPETRLFICHDYAPGGRDYAWETTVAEERASNIHLADDHDEEDFVEMRTTRDAKLRPPGLLLPALQCNIRGGRLPPAGPDGVAYLRLPLNAF